MSDVSQLLDPAAEEEYEIESTEGGLWTGSRLFVGLVTMAWSGVAFAYFYLRAIDRSGQWDPHHLTPPPVIGTLIALCVLLGAFMLEYGRHQLRRGLRFEWLTAAWLTALFGAIAGGFQIWQLTRLPFYPGEYGYTSVFIGFAPLNVAMVLGGAYWVETIAARSIRLRAEVGPDVHLGESEHAAARHLRASLAGCNFYWWFMVLVSLLFWILFYVVD